MSKRDKHSNTISTEQKKESRKTERKTTSSSQKRSSSFDWKKAFKVAGVGVLGFTAAALIKIGADYKNEVPQKRLPKIKYKAENFDFCPSLFEHFSLLELFQNLCPNNKDLDFSQNLVNQELEIDGEKEIKKQELLCCDPYLCVNLETSIDSFFATIKRMNKGDYSLVVFFHADIQFGEDHWANSFNFLQAYSRQIQKHLKPGSYKSILIKETIENLQKDLLLALDNFTMLVNETETYIYDNKLKEGSSLPLRVFSSSERNKDRDD